MRVLEATRYSNMRHQTVSLGSSTVSWHALKELWETLVHLQYHRDLKGTWMEWLAVERLESGMGVQVVYYILLKNGELDPLSYLCNLISPHKASLREVPFQSRHHYLALDFAVVTVIPSSWFSKVVLLTTCMSIYYTWVTVCS